MPGGPYRLRATTASVRWPTTSRPRRIHERLANSRRRPVASATAVDRPPADAGVSRTTRIASDRLAKAASRPSRSAMRAGLSVGASRPPGRSRKSRSTERPERSEPAIVRPSSSDAGVMTTSHSRSMPRATASTGSNERARSSQATTEPWAWASAATRSARVVRPLEPSPRMATLADLRQAAGPEDRIERREAGVDDAVVVPAWVVVRVVPRRLLGEWRDGERPDDLRSCRSPASLEGRHGCRHVRGKGRHRTVIVEHPF